MKTLYKSFRCCDNAYYYRCAIVVAEDETEASSLLYARAEENEEVYPRGWWHDVSHRPLGKIELKRGEDPILWYDSANIVSLLTKGEELFEAMKQLYSSKRRK
jgi:hypothetical protein